MTETKTRKWQNTLVRHDSGYYIIYLFLYNKKPFKKVAQNVQINDLHFDLSGFKLVLH